ncbi:Chaperone protein dnaJ 1 mitochondrial [Zea mays]|uniref:Chaperone protein dnaJ 1 mitochondrial n=1 Tax=Zea mays TaxID=4577 RepID=A0A1D6NS05_MAIZE|nr:Chaperone protein dnaJ 1 mitochondrial [Zea mays]
MTGLAEAVTAGQHGSGFSYLLTDGVSANVEEAVTAGQHGSGVSQLVAVGSPAVVSARVEIDPLFTRDGADIHVDKRISFTQAMLGGKVEVPTLNGKTEVKDCQIRQDIWGTNMSDSEFISPRFISSYLLVNTYRWELVAENMTKQNVMVGIGILLLIHLMLSKAMN